VSGYEGTFCGGSVRGEESTQRGPRWEPWRAKLKQWNEGMGWKGCKGEKRGCMYRSDMAPGGRWDRSVLGGGGEGGRGSDRRSRGGGQPASKVAARIILRMGMGVAMQRRAPESGEPRDACARSSSPAGSQKACGLRSWNRVEGGVGGRGRQRGLVRGVGIVSLRSNGRPPRKQVGGPATMQVWAVDVGEGGVSGRWGDKGRVRGALGFRATEGEAGWNRARSRRAGRPTRRTRNCGGRCRGTAGRSSSWRRC